MDECIFAYRCIVETIEGLREGLTQFSGPSRTAVIYSIKPDDPIHIYDPQNLLAGHEPKFKELMSGGKRLPFPMTKKNLAI
jgi:hypothetical protein